MSGAGLAARLDETPLDASFLSTNSNLALTGAATVTGAIVIKVLLGLFTRFRADPLSHPRRKAILEYVTAHPGANFREVARATETATGTARHHLSVLKRNGLIMERAHGGTNRFFENHGKFDANWSDVVLLRDPALKAAYDWIASHPNVPQKDILFAMERDHAWSRSTTQHRLERLVEGGMVSYRLQGRLKFYTARAERGTTPPPLVAPAVAAGPLVPSAPVPRSAPGADAHLPDWARRGASRQDAAPS